MDQTLRDMALRAPAWELAAEPGVEIFERLVEQKTPRPIMAGQLLETIDLEALSQTRPSLLLREQRLR